MDRVCVSDPRQVVRSRVTEARIPELGPFVGIGGHLLLITYMGATRGIGASEPICMVTLYVWSCCAT